MVIEDQKFGSVMKRAGFCSLVTLLILGTFACAGEVPRGMRSVAPEQIGWKEVGRFAVEGLQEPRAIAVDGKGEVYVASKQAIGVFSLDGKLLRTVKLAFEPRCLTVDKNGAIFAASDDRVWKVDKDKTIGSHAIPGAVLTAVAVGEDHLFVADAGNRRVWQFERSLTDGAKPKRFGKDNTRFIVPSPYFDLAVGADGLLRVVDPGRHRIKHFTQEGYHEVPLDWGTTGMKLQEFPTCCNPAHIALLSDGAVVTVEKKIPRVKVYELDGTLRSVVIDPEGLIGKRDFDTFAPRLVVDVAVGPDDEIYLLDPLAKEVRRFRKTR